MAAKDTKKMEIHTCYTVKIKHQLDAVPDRKTKKLNISRKRRVDDRSMQQTAEICLEALRFCVDVALKEWDHVKAQERRRAGGHLISCSMGVRKKLQNIQSLISAFQTCQHI